MEYEFLLLFIKTVYSFIRRKGDYKIFHELSRSFNDIYYDKRKELIASFSFLFSFS